MGGWDQEVFWAKFCIGLVQEFLGMKEQMIKSYCSAYQYRPSRGEPLYHLAKHYYETEDYALSYVLAKQGLTLPIPKDFIYVIPSMYESGFLYLMAKSAVKLGKIEEASESFKALLTHKNLPENICGEVQMLLEELQKTTSLQK
jgi:tetratricopeptide (TPR) repeat protein